MQRTFGCEFEFSSPWEDIEEKARQIISKIYKRDNFHARQEHFYSTNNKKWHLKTDSSTECEFCTPVSKARDLKKICQVIARLRCKKIKVTKHDSLHVHIYVPDVSMKRLLAAWLLIEKTLIKCFPKHRRQKYDHPCKMTYCGQLIASKGNVAKLLEKAEERSKDHHSAMSLHYYERRKTVEFRIAEGTVDEKFIKIWIMFLMQFVKFAKTIDPFEVLCKMPQKMEVWEMLELVGCKNSKIQEEFERRYERFNASVAEWQTRQA